MSSLPFLRLSEIAQSLILEYLSLIQLFDFSLLSKKTLKIAKARKRKVVQLDWSIRNRCGKHKLNVTSPEGDDCLWIQVPVRSYKMRHFPVEEAIFHEKSVQMVRRKRQESDFLFIGSEETLVTADEQIGFLEQLSQHFLDMLDVESFVLTVEKTMDVTTCFVWNYTRILKELKLSYKMTAGEMKFILEDLTIRKLIICCAVEDGFQWQKPLKSRRNHFDSASWLSLEAFLNTDCEEWIIRDQSLPRSYLTEVVKKWLSGDWEKLERFEVALESGLDEVLEGIETFPWSTNNRPKEWRYFDVSKGRDVRNIKGILATATAERGRFQFVVWHPEDLQ